MFKEVWLATIPTGPLIDSGVVSRMLACALHQNDAPHVAAAVPGIQQEVQRVFLVSTRPNFPLALCSVQVFGLQ
jgi:hypothetical protein